MMTILLLSALQIAFFQALYTGYIPLSSTTVQQDDRKKISERVKRWVICFFPTVIIGIPLSYVIGPFLLHSLHSIEYLLALFVAVINLLTLFLKENTFLNFSAGTRWVIVIGVLQGIGTWTNISWMYTLSTEITLLTVAIVNITYALVFCTIVCLFATLTGLLAGTHANTRRALTLLLSLLGIAMGIFHFILNII